MAGTLVAGVQASFQPNPVLAAIWKTYQPAPDEISSRDRGDHIGIVRLRPNVAKEAAAAELNAFAAQFAVDYQDATSHVTPFVTPLIEEVSGAFKTALWTLLGAVSVFLASALATLSIYKW
jgi:hypothetical protein